MSNVECRVRSRNALNRVQKFVQRLRGEPEAKKKSENRAAGYVRESMLKSVALSGPTGEVWNEQLRYSTVNSKGEEYPRNKKILY